MTLTVEDGTGLADADTYATLDEADAYAAAQGLMWEGSTEDKEAALRRATLWLDTTYRGRFPGMRRYGRQQALEWPRSGAMLPVHNASGYGYGTGVGYMSPYGYVSAEFGSMAGYEVLPYDSVPVEIERATIEAAARQLADNLSLLPDVSSSTQIGTAAIKKRSAGGHTEEFFPGGSIVTASTSGGSRGPYPMIDAILAGILIRTSGYTARAARA